MIFMLSFLMHMGTTRNWDKPMLVRATDYPSYAEGLSPAGLRLALNLKGMEGMF